MIDFSSAARWIRLPGAETMVNDHVDFRCEFSVENQLPAPALLIAADSDFVAMLDGEEVGRGQYSDYPDAPTWSEFPLRELNAGRHVLAVLFFYRGEDFSTYRTGPAGLIAEIPGAVISDASWRCRRDPAFRSGPIERTTGQLGFVAGFDARKSDNWCDPAYDAFTWERVECFDRPGRLSPRPVPPQRIGAPLLPVTLQTEGFLFRPESARDAATYADAVRQDQFTFVPPGPFFGLPQEYGDHLPVIDGKTAYRVPVPEAPANGAWLIVDLGGEHAGYLTLDFDAPAGTVLDISHGEHLTDGRVRNKIGPRCFTDRYIAHAGRNVFTLPFRRLGGRYLQLNITEFSEPLTFRFVTLLPAELPLPEQAPFDCGDALADKLRATAIRTLRLCMHEHYEDCPWREQSLYAYDSRNQALYGYYVWGNWKFAEACFTLLGNGLRAEDGWLELCAPARCGVTIPVFTLTWMVELAEHGLYSGSDVLYRRFAAQLDAMLRRILTAREPETGLARVVPGKAVWNFYEWVPGLDGTTPFDPAESWALYNLYLILALRAVAEMRRRAGEDAAEWEREADLLAAAVDRAFWAEERSFYATSRKDGTLSGAHEHTQIMALLCSIGDETRRRAVVGKLLADEGLVRASFSSMPLFAQALMPQSPEARKFVFKRMAQCYEPLLFTRSDTLWETPAGEGDFDGAGSLCHAWSSLPVYIQSAWQLGIQPLEPGFRRFRVAPVPGNAYRMSGEVPTPHGNIRAAWTKTPEGLELEVEAPAECEAVFQAWPESPFRSVRWNGHIIQDY